MSNAPEIIIEAPLKGPHARRRFTRHLAKVQQLLDEACAAKGPASPAQVFFQYNARTPMFMLQALGRVYEHLGLNDKLFARIRLEAKIIEDALGNMDYWLAVAKKSIDWSIRLALATRMLDSPVSITRYPLIRSNGRNRN